MRCAPSLDCAALLEFTKPRHLMKAPQEGPGMSLTELFQKFGAPLANSRWSWGSVRPDGTVFLRVWADEMRSADGGRYVRLINRGAYADTPDNLGFAERCEHVERLANGAPGY